jgi:hypothetical protein
MAMGLRLSWALVACGAALATAHACGGSAESGVEGVTSSSGSGGNTSGTQSGTGTGGFGQSCSPPCEAGKFCSGIGKCIADGTCADDADCGKGLVCNEAKSKCEPGGGCGSMVVPVAPIAPNLLIQLDRSCSMTTMVGGKTKWQAAVAAINKMTTTFAGKIRFGLAMFPDKVNPNCDQGPIPISPAPGTEMAIQTLLTAALKTNDVNYPNGPCVTNIDGGMHQVSLAPELADATRGNYVLLITDGAQSAGCSLYGGANGAVKIAADLFAKKVATFVIGFDAGVNSTELNKLADAGGVPTGDPMTHYYNAADQAALEMALDTIAKLTKGCSYELNQKVSDPDLLFVFFDKKAPGVPRDKTHMGGWDYDPVTNAITFYGQACTDLKTGKIQVLDIVYGCDQVPQ